MSYTPTPEQQAILGHDLRRHGRVLAGPGTGKSATMISLLETQLPLNPSLKAKLLTFTRAATAELASKVKGNASLANLSPSTIHSFCISVLMTDPGLGSFPRPLRLADDWEQNNVVRPTLAKRLGIKQTELDDLIAEMAANWESLTPVQSPAVSPQQRARFLGGWEEHRRILGYTLLAELPYALHKSIEQHPDLGKGMYDLLVVDEYQDLNACDLSILREVGRRGCAILAAGDDDQSIYSWRKAHPAGIRQFAADFTGSADYVLSVTLRCARKIVEWANWVIAQDVNRPTPRALQPHAHAEDGDVRLLSFKSEIAEAKGIAALVEDLTVSKQVAPGQVLILLRGDHNGQFSKNIKDALDTKQIPYTDPNWVKDVLDDLANRTLLCRLRLAVNHGDSLAWAGLLKATLGIGQRFFDYIYDKAGAAPSGFGAALLAAYSSGFAGGPKASSEKARTLIENTLKAVEAMKVPSVFPEGGWGPWLLSTFKGNAGTDEFWTLLTTVDERLGADEIELGQYLNQITPLARDAALASENGVRIMSLASSKGLTVEAAIVAGLEDGVIPRDDADLAEERRLLYVGMTRAKRHLYCTWARRRSGPTARYGRENARGYRSLTPFLAGGIIQSENGDELASSVEH